MRAVAAILLLSIAFARIGREQHVLNARSETLGSVSWSAALLRKTYESFATQGFGYMALGGAPRPLIASGARAGQPVPLSVSIASVDAKLRDTTPNANTGEVFAPCPATPPVDVPLALAGLGLKDAQMQHVNGKVTLRLWCGITAADPRVMSALVAFKVAAIALDRAAGAWALPSHIIVNVLPFAYTKGRPFQFASVSFVSFGNKNVQLPAGAGGDPASPAEIAALRASLTQSSIFLAGNMLNEVAEAPGAAMLPARGGASQGGAARSVGDSVYAYAPAASQKDARAQLVAISAIATDAKVMHEVCHMMHQAASPLSYVSNYEPAWTQQERSACAKGVSQYAGSHPNECIAEICAAKALGLALSPAVEAFYIAQGGPAGITPVLAEMLQFMTPMGHNGWGWKNAEVV